MLQILNLSMASKKISIPFSCLQKFLLSPLFPSKNFKTLKKSFAYPPSPTWRYSQDFPENDKFTASYQTMRYLPKSIIYIKRCKQQKRTLKNLFLKQTIIIRFNLLHVCPFMRLFVFALFSYLMLVFWGFILCFTYFAGSSLFLNYNTFRATAPVSQCSAYSFLGKYPGKKLTL